MADAQQLAACLACRGAQFREFLFFIQQEDLRVVILETVAHQIHDLRQQRVEVENLTGGVGDLRRCFKLLRAAVGLFQQQRRV